MVALLLSYVALQITSSLSQTVAPCAFNSMCTCKSDPELSYQSLKDITCVGVPFARLPDLPNSQVAHVDIVSSGLELLENESFGSLQVESLRLISNKISLVGGRAFSVMPAVLKSLDLSYNELQEIPFEAFRPLRNLDWINLHSNAITSLSTGDWGHLRGSITNMYLGENDLTELPQTLLNHDLGMAYSSQSLAEFRALTWINLESNKLTQVKEGMLPRTLQTLSISGNYLTTFPVEIIEDMPALTWLYLSGNYIEHIPDYEFKYKDSLDSLDLAENGIKEITRTIFNGTITIKELHLELNSLQTLPPQAFRGLNLARLYLPNNKLRDMDDKALVGTGPFLEFLDLEGNRLNQVPKALRQLKRLRYLYIANNNISELQEDDLESFTSVLKAFSISGNNLEAVPYMALKDCVKLSHLNVGYNRISQINESDFDNWGDSLNTLLLRNNRITELPANVFRRLRQLRDLSLSFNKLSYIHKDAFADLEFLESLEMSFSVYSEEFPKEYLRHLKSLTWLSLDNNHIRTLSGDALNSFDRLQYINLESNRIEEVPATLFHEVIHNELKDVRLSYNNIGIIEENTFCNLKKLQNLILNGNKIKKLRQNAFSNLENLISLSITNNQMRNLGHRTFVALPSLMKLELQFNQLREVSLHAFLNITNPETPMLLNLSNNQISNLSNGFTGTEMFVKTLDLSHNHLHEVPVNVLQNFFKSLKNLNLGYNQISKLDRSAFGDLKYLEVLNLEHNNVVRIERKAFQNLYALQLVKLASNHIEQLQTDQFKNLENLRILDLSNNRVRSVSKEIFQNTRIESLLLNNNEFVVVPSNALGEVGYTLRHLDLALNHLEHLDSTMFQEVPFLTSLNLSSNRLTILPDNVFIEVGNLITLDLSHNPLRSNFKELFHYVRRLRTLQLANTGLTNVPALPLPNLVTLNLSSNHIDTVYINAVEQLNKLRTLILSENKLTHIPANIWPYMPLLKSLDISKNPIKIITKDSLNGLSNLQSLDVSFLSRLERFDSDSFIKLQILSSVRIQTWPRIEKYRFRLGSLLTHVPSLRKLSVEVLESHLTDQLVGCFNPKLKQLEITGSNLRSIEPDAFEGAEQVHELMLRIRGTSITDLKPGVLSKLHGIRHLSLDLRSNKLRSLAPHSLYANGTSYQNIATKMISGGLMLSDNPWSCDCGLIWLGHWLRHWLRETLQIHTVVLEVAQHMNDLIREAKCMDATGQLVSIVDLYPEDLSCHASALSRGGSERVRPTSLAWTLVFSIYWCLS